MTMVMVVTLSPTAGTKDLGSTAIGDEPVQPGAPRLHEPTESGAQGCDQGRVARGNLTPGLPQNGA
jgi:hypothetical protein